MVAVLAWSQPIDPAQHYWEDQLAFTPALTAGGPFWAQKRCQTIFLQYQRGLKSDGSREGCRRYTDRKIKFDLPELLPARMQEKKEGGLFIDSPFSEHSRVREKVMPGDPSVALFGTPARVREGDTGRPVGRSIFGFSRRQTTIMTLPPGMQG